MAAPYIQFPRTKPLDDTGFWVSEWYKWLQSPSFLSVAFGTALGVPSGGTGTSSLPANGQLLIGNGLGYTLGNLTAGTGLTVTNGPGTVVARITNTAVTAASYGTASRSASFTVNQQGQLTAASDSAIAITSAAVSGTATNDSAAAGFIGEYTSVLVASGAAVSLSNGVAKNVTTLALTAGDWDVSASINFIGTGATITGGSGGINITTATLPTDGSEVYDGTITTLLSDTSSITPATKRISLAAPGTAYLVASKNFSAGTVTAFGFLGARRAR